LPSFRLTRVRVVHMYSHQREKRQSTTFILHIQYVWWCRRVVTSAPSCRPLWTALALLLVPDMPVRLRLQRFGRTHSPFYRMVAADSRSPRDGKFLEMVQYAVFCWIPRWERCSPPPCACVSLTCSYYYYYYYDRLERTIPLPTRVALKKYVSRRIG
jgi:hypothetical protein